MNSIKLPKPSRWWHYKKIKAPRYVLLALIVIGLFAVLAVLKSDWAYLERSGGVIALLGALLGLRKLLRKGARELDKPNDPLWLDKGHGTLRQFNIDGMWQEVEDLSDSFAQELGLILVIIGTIVSAVGAPLMQVIYPLAA